MEKNEIIAAIKEWKNFKSESEFAKALGVTPQTLNNWRSKNTFDFDKVRKAFPELSAKWLLSGQGEMIEAPGESENASPAPVIPDDLVRQSGTNILDWMEENVRSTERLRVSQLLPPFDMFYRVICDAMKPNVEKGDLLALKALVDKRKIIDGECYVIDSANHGLIIRRLHYKDGIYTCECNLKELGTIEIAEKDVFSVFAIVGLVRLRVSSHSETTRLWNANDRKDKIIESLIKENESKSKVIDNLLEQIATKNKRG